MCKEKLLIVPSLFHIATVNKTRLKIENIGPILVSAYIWNKNPLGRKLDTNSITFAVQCLQHQQYQTIV